MTISLFNRFIQSALLIILAAVIPYGLLSQVTFSTQKYEELYSSYKEKSIQDRRLKHAQVEPLLLALSKDKAFDVDSVGASVEGRAIYHVKWGSGPVKILMWTQMHGDEPTATMAMLDLFNFLKDRGQRDDWVVKMHKTITLHCLPLLNPDGAERYQRHTALGIDMNRDALNLVQPESRILKSLRDKTNADWGFNLHDQSRYYSAGPANKSARFSFLAPAYNEQKEINEKREEAMQLIALMNDYLQQSMAGHVGKFNDTFEPRAFGDNIQAWGTRTILIESGGTKNDREKQNNRKTQFMLYLIAMDAIADKKYKAFSRLKYDEIPFNNRRMYDLIIENAELLQFDMRYKVDLGIKQHEYNISGATDFRLDARIEEIGDLRTRASYHHFDATGFKIEKAERVLYVDDPKLYDNHKWLYNNLKDGIVLYCGAKPSAKLEQPIIWQSDCGNHKQEVIQLGSNPVLFFKKAGKRTHVLVNGQIHKITHESPND